MKYYAVLVAIIWNNVFIFLTILQDIIIKYNNIALICFLINHYVECLLFEFIITF
jgi:hypothetical protein